MPVLLVLCTPAVDMVRAVDCFDVGVVDNSKHFSIPEKGATIRKTIYSSGTTANTENKGVIDVRPNTRYYVRFEVLQNDLGSSSEKVTHVLVDGEDLGECNPDGGDYDCTFFDCSVKNQKSLTVVSSSGKVDVNMKFTGHSHDCDCDTTTWECLRAHFCSQMG